MKSSVITIILFVVGLQVQGQFTRYIVRFKDRAGTSYSLTNPTTYLSQRAIDRRTRYAIALDSSDLPVNPAYINQLKNISGLSVLNSSRWMNAVSISVTSSAVLTLVNALPFVQSSTSIAARTPASIPNPTATPGKWQESIKPLPSAPGVIARTNGTTGIEGDYFDYGSFSFNEIHLHNGEFLHDIGLRGQGMQVAVLDGGFYHYTTLKAFDSLNANHQVLDTWDFVFNENSVVEDDPHGMECLSTIAANIPGQFIGKAPKASFYLYKTEDVASEYPIEEFNWVCGAERADSSGADVISTSVGYTTFDNSSFDHTYADMNGHTTIAAQGADLAVKKGLLVVASVGNDGSGPWHYLGTPADADSVLAIGAVNSAGVVGNFSSYGPSSDGQVKPDLASVGVSALIQDADNNLGQGLGTSFACPNMAGLATCLWQGFPEFNSMKIVRTLQAAGSIASSPDTRIGYGIPDMKKAFGNLLTEYATSTASINNCAVTINWHTKDVAGMRYEIERKTATDPAYVKIGSRLAFAENGLNIHDYSFLDVLSSSVSAGSVSYRIRQVIDTTAAGFSAVYINPTTVDYAQACTPIVIEYRIYLSPNPVTGMATIVFEPTAAIPRLSLLLYDMNGRLLWKETIAKPGGPVLITVPSEKLPNGTYEIRLYDDHKLITTKRLLKL